MSRRKAPHEKLKPGPKPGFRRIAPLQMAGAPPPAPAADPAPSPEAAPEAAHDSARPNMESKDPLQRHRNMATMSEAELRMYAKQIGVSRRDADCLAPDRLRQNCMTVLTSLIEELSA